MCLTRQNTELRVAWTWAPYSATGIRGFWCPGRRLVFPAPFATCWSNSATPVKWKTSKQNNEGRVWLGSRSPLRESLRLFCHSSPRYKPCWTHTQVSLSSPVGWLEKTKQGELVWFPTSQILWFQMRLNFNNPTNDDTRSAIFLCFSICCLICWS